MKTVFSPDNDTGSSLSALMTSIPHIIAAFDFRLKKAAHAPDHRASLRSSGGLTGTYHTALVGDGVALFCRRNRRSDSVLCGRV